jgi:hypothetical protein
MKKLQFNYSKITLLLGLIIITMVSCERDLSDDAVTSGFSTEGDIFIDTFVAMGSDFYLPFAGSKLDAFSVDENEGYESSASYRVDVPNANDPNGNYAGAILRVDGAGRDLSGFDALTFWAKASQGVNVGEVGFGLDFIEDKYNTAAQNLSVSTSWTKYVVPIPVASKLLNERGVFWYSAGTQGTGGSGYTLWFDDIKFEKLGNIGQPRPAIRNGNDDTETSFIGVSFVIDGLTKTVNLGSGADQTVNAAPSYFEFTSSNPSVATIDEQGLIRVIGSGTTVITATLDGLDAQGSLTIDSLGDFTSAPIPTRDPSNVISIFSDAYTNVPVDFYNGFWEPFQTTLSADFAVDGDNILNYTNFNFVGNQFSNPTVDATEKSNLHIDMFIPGELPSFFDFLISVVDFGPDGEDGGGDDSRQQIFIREADVVADSWMSFDFPLTLPNRDNLGLIIYENINFATLDNFYLDNVYFYGEPTGPTDAPDAPTEDEVANNVISVFSDEYTDVANDGLNNFASGSILSVETIASNEVLKYSNLDFTGLEFLGANIIDATATTTLHLDIWSPDANELKIKLVDFGPDGAFGGGDDTEHEINFGPTATGEWVAYDIPLSDFVGLASTEHLAQIILVNAPVGTLFVDNLYFYN